MQHAASPQIIRKIRRIRTSQILLTDQLQADNTFQMLHHATHEKILTHDV